MTVDDIWTAIVDEQILESSIFIACVPITEGAFGFAKINVSDATAISTDDGKIKFCMISIMVSESYRLSEFAEI